jgi:hypothetical protein
MAGDAVGLTSDEWLDREFFPVVASLPDMSEPDVTDQMRTLAAIIGLKMMGSIDALVSVGVVTAEQEERCRTALEAKGLKEERKTVVSFSSAVSGLVTAGRLAPTAPASVVKDRLRKVVGANQIVGLVEDEPCTLVSVEIWGQRVRAGLLIEVGDEAGELQTERHRQLADWLHAKRIGEATDADRPDFGPGHGFPGMSVTWVLEAADNRVVGVLASGHGGDGWRRIEVEWDLTLPDNCAELVITAQNDSQVTGKATVRL